jgi:hypothetical protein
VERASCYIGGVNVLLEPLEHFSRSLIRERKGKNALRFDAIINEVQDLFRYYTGFA